MPAPKKQRVRKRCQVCGKVPRIVCASGYEWYHCGLPDGEEGPCCAEVVIMEQLQMITGTED